jgi:beta-lactamase class A
MLEEQLQSLIATFPGVVGLVIHNPAGDYTFRHNEDELFPAASLIKLPILWEFFRQVEAGRIMAGERISLATNHKVGGSGVLQALETGLNPTLKDLAALMIIASDNVATNVLIDWLEPANINQTMRRLGLKATRLERKMMDFARAQRGFENVTTAADLARLLQLILASDHLTAESRQAMLTILKQQQFNDRLSADWPEEVTFAHKTGHLPGIEHDAGILYLDQWPIIIAALTQSPTSGQAGAALCRDIGRLLTTLPSR